MVKLALKTRIARVHKNRPPQPTSPNALQRDSTRTQTSLLLLVSITVTVRSSASNPYTTSAAGQQKKKKNEAVLHIPVDTDLDEQALLNRPDAFALRRELCARIEGLTTAQIPAITPIPTGWAIRASDLTVRDLLATQENSEIIKQVLHGKAVIQPQTWINYAVPGVPTTLRDLFGDVVKIDATIVAEEVAAQTTVSPINVRPSKHGANARTGKLTWIVSFLDPVKPFKLFGTSENARRIDKKSSISRHDPGCQGFCNPSKCTRYSRCSNCSARMDEHPGPSGLNCTAKAKCANCHGPFPADHSNCPATPKRGNGKLIKPTKKELDIIRRYGDKCFRDHHAPVDVTPQDSQPRPRADNSQANVTTTSRKRKGAAVSAHEQGGQHIHFQDIRPPTGTTPTGTQSSSAVAPASTPGASLPPSSQPTSSRPKRSTVSGKNLNNAQLSAQSLQRADESDEDMEG